MGRARAGPSRPDFGSSRAQPGFGPSKSPVGQRARAGLYFIPGPHFWTGWPGPTRSPPKA
ncbi:hypothetical protein PanWU01x14_194210, partial [Parasponia andersonii]